MEMKAVVHVFVYNTIRFFENCISETHFLTLWQTYVIEEAFEEFPI